MAQQIKTMDVSALIELRGKIDALLAGKRKELEAQLAAFNASTGGNGRIGSMAKTAKASNGKAGRRAKAAPKYQSKKDKSVKWSGRGMTPI
jgi:hypothetical protein